MIEDGMIETAWRFFAEQSVAKGTSDEQVADMRRIFFAGWLSALTETMVMSPQQEKALNAELEDFEDEIAAWDAGQDKRLGTSS